MNRKFINTKKEQFIGFDYFKKHYLPSKDEFDYRIHKREGSDYFASYGFEVSMSYADYFSKMWYPHYSDKFISDDVYYFYILPALNRFDFIDAYMDKNNLDRLFPDVNRPATIIKNINGRYYTSINECISENIAIDIVKACCNDLIIKPSVETGGGSGIALISTGCNDEFIKKEFESRGSDFIVQKRLEQSRVMSSLNESSLNTLRIYTYRSKSDGIVLIASSIRIGGKGSIIDNASGGGGFCHVGDDGLIDNCVMQYKTLKKCNLKEFRNLTPLHIPNYDSVKALVKELHSKLPYFDLVGWDIAIDKENNPVFVEMNLTPESGFAQMNNGPMFGKYLEEVINRTVQVEKQEDLYMRFSYPNGSYRLLRI